MSQKILAIKGMNDVVPSAQDAFLDSSVWRSVHETSTRVLEAFGYNRVWLPSVESTQLFARGIGEGTDIVSKEMYSFTDRGDRELTLRPEGTAGAVRAYVQHAFGRGDPVQKWWYAGPMFRAERPQKGRYRQFYQIGAELFGVAAPSADAELLIALDTWCKALELHGIAVRINSLGDQASRAAYREALRAYLKSHLDALCESCRDRVDVNPLRALDCKRPTCREVADEAPDIAASLTPASAAHFDGVLSLVNEAGVECVRDRRLVRGLDYYTGTVFEFTTDALGAQDAVLGGGRYDDLVAELGGPATPAIGFAAGVERICHLLTLNTGHAEAGPDLYIVPMQDAGHEALSKSWALAATLRERGFAVEVDVSAGRLKHQMRRADRVGARCALVLGEVELAEGRATLKLLRSGAKSDAKSEPTSVSLDAREIEAALGASNAK